MFHRSIFLLLLGTFYWPELLAGDGDVYTSGWKKIIPSENLPHPVIAQRSNNNIDAVSWQGRHYIAFRTAPTHFASKETKLYVISTTDLVSWQYETEIALGSDIREPRLVVYRDTLRLYFFQGGTEAFKFEPKHIFTSVNTAGWSPAVDIELDGYVPWRLRVRDSVLYLSAYDGRNLYNDAHRADLRLFRSANGYDFEPITIEPQDTTLGAEEGEFIFDKQGNLWANIRLEGSGSLLCYADKDSIGTWQKKFSTYKYDSALMFEHENDIYMISRRHLKGEATRRMVPKPFRRKMNLLKYSLSKKTTCLFKLDKAAMEWKALLDFPSTGDTAFPALFVDSDHAYHVLNYSNDIRKREKIWLLGQLRPTYIYHAVLYFDK
jgi:hypothetical protein